MEEMEISEIAIRLKNFNQLYTVFFGLNTALSGEKNQQGQPVFEVHTWESLSPFFNIAQMINVMTLFIRIMLIAIVLVSVMNVMIMAVYERMREIGTIASIGTPPGRILSLFVLEGFSLGVFGAFVGTVVSLLIIFFLNLAKFSFTFARQSFVLSPTIGISDVLITSLIVIIVAVLGSLQPAFKASRMEPIEALRHV
jgi:putative ABC transport system permease protein